MCFSATRCGDANNRGAVVLWDQVVTIVVYDHDANGNWDKIGVVRENWREFLHNVRMWLSPYASLTSMRLKGARMPILSAGKNRGVLVVSSLERVQIVPSPSGRWRNFVLGTACQCEE